MDWSDEEADDITSPISISDDELSKILHNAKVDMSDVDPFHSSAKKVRFKDDIQVRWVTSPNANTEYLVCQHQGQKIISALDEKELSCVSVEEILNANKEYVEMKIRTEKEVVINQSLAEVLRCSICTEKLQDARLCPYCSKLCCLACIKRWWSEHGSQCPSCRAWLHVQDMVKCRWVEGVTQRVDTSHNTSPKHACDAAAADDGKDVCREHQEKKTVYCWTCHQCLCHQCALWGGSHTGHTFKPLDGVYKDRVHKLTTELSWLHQRREKLLGLVQDVERSMERTRRAKEDGMREIRHTVEPMVARLENQCRDRLQTLRGQSKRLRQESALWDSVLTSAERKLNTNCRSRLLERSADIMTLFHKLRLRHVPDYVTAPVPVEFGSEIVPRFDTSTFVLRDFSVLRQRADPVYSPPLCVSGLRWRLKVYPDGNGEVRGHFLSVFLELTAGLPETSKYQYRLEMVHPHNRQNTLNTTTTLAKKNVVREFASDFAVGECWGYKRFVALDLLVRQGYLDPSDTLTLRLHVRPPTYFHQCRQLRWYVGQLEASSAQHSQEISELKERLRQEVCRQNCEEKASSPEPQLPTQQSEPNENGFGDRNIKNIGQAQTRADSLDNKDAASPESSGEDSAIGDFSDTTDCNDELEESEEGAAAKTDAILSTPSGNRNDADDIYTGMIPAVVACVPTTLTKNLFTSRSADTSITD